MQKKESKISVQWDPSGSGPVGAAVPLNFSRSIDRLQFCS